MKSQLRRWTKGRPWFVCFPAIQIAMSAEEVYGLCRMAREKRPFTLDGKTPAYEHWHRFYEADFYIGSPPVPEQLLQAGVTGLEAAFIEFTRRWMYLSEAQRKQYLESCDPLAEAEKIKNADALAGMLEMLLRGIETGVMDEPSDSENMVALIATPELQFYLQVFIPCIVEYGETVKTLFEKCGSDDAAVRFESLTKLLRVDRYAKSHPKLQKLYHQAFDEGNTTQRDELTKASNQVPERDLTLQNFKYRLAAEIYSIFSGMDSIFQFWKAKALAQGRTCEFTRTKLTYEDIRDLFDAVASYRNAGEYKKDADLPRDMNTFSQGVRRSIRFWPKYFEI